MLVIYGLCGMVTKTYQMGANITCRPPQKRLTYTLTELEGWCSIRFSKNGKKAPIFTQVITDNTGACGNIENVFRRIDRPQPHALLISISQVLAAKTLQICRMK